MKNWLIDLDGAKLPPLKSGAHSSPQDGMCAMEMTAYMAREPHSDRPACTCPVLAAYVRKLNDRMTDNERQRLLPYLPRLIGTVSKEHQLERATVAAWRAIKVFAPLALEKRWPEQAALLREFDETRGLRAASKAAAAYAAYAADAAAAYAADAAAYAADAAAAYAADAAAAYAASRTLAIDAALKLLDDMLAIGPQGKWTGKQAEILMELAALSA